MRNEPDLSDTDLNIPFDETADASQNKASPEITLDLAEFAILEKLVTGQSAALIDSGDIRLENGHVVKLWLDGDKNLVGNLNMLGDLRFLRDLSFLNFNSTFLISSLLSILEKLLFLRWLSFHNVDGCTRENKELIQAIDKHLTLEIVTILSSQEDFFGRRHKDAGWEWISGSGRSTDRNTDAHIINIGSQERPFRILSREYKALVKLVGRDVLQRLISEVNLKVNPNGRVYYFNMPADVITDLAPLQILTGLQFLSLPSREGDIPWGLTDISMIASLTELKCINLSKAKMTDSDKRNLMDIAKSLSSLERMKLGPGENYSCGDLQSWREGNNRVDGHVLTRPSGDPAANNAETSFADL